MVVDAPEGVFSASGGTLEDCFAVSASAVLLEFGSDGLHAHRPSVLLQPSFGPLA